MRVGDFFRDEFLPSVQSAVFAGLIVIKHDFQIEWLESIVDLLVEAFDESRSLQRLKSPQFTGIKGASLVATRI